MRLILLCVLSVILTFGAYSQNNQLSELLEPDPSSVAEAKRMGAEVIKLLPRGFFKDLSSSDNREKDNPVGVRGGGAYFSFATGSHSYNETPQIELQNGHFSTGFAGMDYGFFVDLGEMELASLDPTSREALYFLNYKSPVFEKDIRLEHGSVHGKRIGEFTTYGALSAVVGHSYLLRAINFGEADTLVAFQVLKIGADGSTTIAWKKLAEFGEPYFLYMPDDELRVKVSAIIAAEKLTGIEFSVKDNELYMKGSAAGLKNLNRALSRNGIHWRGATVEVR
jgi:hypothetical protein